MKKLIAIFFVVAVFAGGFLWLVQSNSLSALTSQSSETDSEQTISAEEQAQINQESAELQQIVDNFSANYPSTVKVSVIDLQNEASASYDQSSQTVSASLYKLFVAYGIYQMIDNGDLSSSQNISSLDMSVTGCLDAMITVSDNACGKALGDLVGWDTLDSNLATQGYLGTTLNNYDNVGNVIDDKYTTTYDVALLLKRLYDGNLLTKTSSAKFIALLKQQTYNDWLPSGLPASTVIAHKTGALYGYIHDAGIVYGASHNYIVVIMSGEWETPETTAPSVFADLSDDLWQYFKAI